MAVVDERWQGAPVRPLAPTTFDRQPPQDLAAEQSVLGGMLMSKDAIADVIEALRSGDFYKPAHTLVFDAVLNLYSRGEPADAITVASELDKAGSLSRVGGAVYLHTLMATVPTAANAGFYAQIVAEKEILRRLVEAGTRIVQLGYGGNEGDVGGGEVDEIVDRAQAEIYEVTERRTSEDYVILEELLQPTMDEIDAIAMAGGQAAGVPTGFADLDNLTNGLHPGQMIIVAARPGIGKSTLALDIARHAAVKHRKTAVIFSLEMSKTEITMRLLSAEAGIRLSQMRSGSMSEQDWQQIVRRMTKISDAPLFIDDSPNMTMIQIRAKARRLKAAPRPEAGRGGLPAVDDLGQAGRVPAAGGQRLLPADEAAGQGTRGTGDRHLPAQPWPGAAHRQTADALGPARVRVAGTGRGHGDPGAPAGRLGGRRPAGRGGRPDHRQAPQRPDHHRRRGTPAALLRVRRPRR